MNLWKKKKSTKSSHGLIPTQHVKCMILCPINMIIWNTAYAIITNSNHEFVEKKISTMSSHGLISMQHVRVHDINCGKIGYPIWYWSLIWQEVMCWNLTACLFLQFISPKEATLFSQFPKPKGGYTRARMLKYMTYIFLKLKLLEKLVVQCNTLSFAFPPKQIQILSPCLSPKEATHERGC